MVRVRRVTYVGTEEEPGVAVDLCRRIRHSGVGVSELTTAVRGMVSLTTRRAAGCMGRGDLL